MRTENLKTLKIHTLTEAQFIREKNAGNLESNALYLTPAKHDTLVAENVTYGEVGEWADGNTSNEDRLGYFVSIDTTTAGSTMVKATSTSDIRGVTVAAPAFSGNCSANKFDAAGNLLKQYDYIALMGLVPVIDNGSCAVNGRCMSNDSGTAVPSTNSMGYLVVDRIDSTHILIAVEPGSDMIQRLKDDFNGLSQPIPVSEIDAICTAN